MIFHELALSDAWLIEPEPLSDERGWFARVRCEEEFSARGLEDRFVQSSLSFNRYKGILRGMHFQLPPFQEVKLIRCVRGAILDVVIDLRPDSRTFLQHLSVEVSSENRLGLYVPKGFAHGFLSLEDETEVLYEISDFYSPDLSRGVRWNDPAFGIQWPISDPIMVERDRTYPDFSLEVLEG